MKTKKEDGYYYLKNGKLTEIPLIPFETLSEGLWLVQNNKYNKSKTNLVYHNIGEIKDVQLYASLLVKYQDKLANVLLKSMETPNSVNNIVNNFLIEVTKLIEKDGKEAK